MPFLVKQAPVSGPFGTSQTLLILPHHRCALAFAGPLIYGVAVQCGHALWLCTFHNLHNGPLPSPGPHLGLEITGTKASMVGRPLPAAWVLSGRAELMATAAANAEAATVRPSKARGRPASARQPSANRVRVCLVFSFCFLGGVGDVVCG